MYQQALTVTETWITLICVEYDDAARSGVGNDYLATSLSTNGHAMSQHIPLGSRPLNYWRLSFSAFPLPRQLRIAEKHLGMDHGLLPFNNCSKTSVHIRSSQSPIHNILLPRMLIRSFLMKKSKTKIITTARMKAIVTMRYVTLRSVQYLLTEFTDDISIAANGAKPRSLQRISSGSAEDSPQTKPATPCKTQAKETFCLDSRLCSACL